MSDDLAIKVEDVSKTFRLPHEKNNSIKTAVIHFYQRNKKYEIQKALQNISFEVKKGEFFGIVGRNGSGKSTMLKLLAGIYSPDSGLVQVNGSLTPFIELGVGFNPELTGRENVFLNGALLGFNRKEMRNMYKDIVEFAEIKRFMDQKLKNYSSGMQVRLAFSIAIRARSDILLLDEVLAVGDAAFQQKCYNYFEQLKRDKRTVVFVSHDMDAIRRFCTKAVLIEKGSVKLVGSPEEVAGQYTLDNIEVTEKDQQLHKQQQNQSVSGEISFLKVRQESGKKLTRKDTFSFQVSYKLKEDVNIDVGYSIVSNGLSVAEQNTKDLSLPSSAGEEHTIWCSVPLENFNPGYYTGDVAIFTRQDFGLIGYDIGTLKFMIEGSDKLRGGPMRAEAKWRLNGQNS